MDICSKSINPIIPEDSNIGIITTAPGGVGRNIATALAYLDLNVSFFTALANDAFGNSLLSSLSNSGIKVICPLFDKTELRTGVYSYTVNSDGTLLCGINDMEINKEISPNRLAAHNNALNCANFVVFDANIPQETIFSLGELAKDKAKLVADCVSVSKCKKLLKVLPSLYLLKANYNEACELAGINTTKENSNEKKDPLAVAQKLAGKGLQRGIITLGKDGAFFFESQASEADSLEWYIMSVPQDSTIINTNGCGDALLAGFISALARGKTNKEALHFALQVASVNARSNEAISKELKTLSKELSKEVSEEVSKEVFKEL